MRSSTRGLSALFLSLLLGLVVGVAPASAHSRLVKISPADGSTLASSPSEIVLTFNEDVNPEFVTVKVTDGEGGSVVGAKATAKGPVVTLPVGDPIAAGTYKVTYRVVSADSHPIAGSSTFTIKGDTLAPPASPTPTPSASAPSASSSASSTPTSSPSASGTAAAAPADDTDGGTPTAVWVIVFGALALAAATAIGLSRRRSDQA